MISDSRAITDVIPSEMRDLNQWLTWFYGEGQRKIPKGKSNDPTTWTSYAAVEGEDCKAFVFSKEDDLCGIDLDDCLIDNEWQEWSLPILDKLRGVAYGEVSPSGKGVKLTTRAKKPAGSRCTNGKGVECYDDGRFWTVTGNVIPGFESIGDGQEAVDWICQTYLVKPQEAKPNIQNTHSIAGSSLVERARSYLRSVQSPGRGDRNNATFRLAGNLFAMLGENYERLSEQDVLALVRDWNQGGVDPLDEAEVLQCVRSAMRNGTPRADKLPSMRHSMRNDSYDNFTITEEASALIRPISAMQLARDHPTMRSPVIDGILRRGETCNVIAAAKVGKSFLVGNLAWCIATGRPWLSHPVSQGRVLVVDNELHESTLASRLEAIAREMAVEDHQRDGLDVMTLRGHGIDVMGLGARLDIEPGKYALIVLDALYRFIPSGTSENDNAQMMAIYNRLDQYAKAWDCAIVVVHHASKGAQGEKAITDVGAGAGSISRAADTHLVIRPHEQGDLYVMDIACRSFKSPEPVSIRYEYPLWSAVACPAQVKTAKGAGEQRQAKQNQETDDAIRDFISTAWLSVSELRKETGFGADRITRSLNRLKANSRRVRSKRTGKSAERFSLQERSKKGEVVR